jgi:hypothetical protein
MAGASAGGPVARSVRGLRADRHRVSIHLQGVIACLLWVFAAITIAAA